MRLFRQVCFSALCRVSGERVFEFGMFGCATSGRGRKGDPQAEIDVILRHETLAPETPTAPNARRPTIEV